MRNTTSPLIVLALSTSIAATIASTVAPGIASAQSGPELPQASPKARIEQRVGITDVSLDYSSPGVKGRKVWGDVVPYDKVWRAGANQPTKLTVSRDFSFAGTAVKAGSYSLFVIPKPGPGNASWTVMLNTDLNATQDAHDAKNDVATVTIKPAALPALRERLRYTLDDTQDDRTMLVLEWERVRIAVPITIDTAKLVTAGIDRAVAAAWRPHFASANYFFTAGTAGTLDRALALVEKSIAIDGNWQNEWLRAQILYKKGQKAEAAASGRRAQELGKGDQGYEQFGKENLQKTMAGWK